MTVDIVPQVLIKPFRQIRITASSRRQGNILLIVVLIAVLM